MSARAAASPELTGGAVEITAEITAELGRVTGRLRSMALDRIPAELVHSTAQRLADLAAVATGRPAYDVPALRPHAAADQLTVMVEDLLRELADEPRAATVLPQALAALGALRRML